MNVILESFCKPRKVKKIVIILITCWFFLSLYLVPTIAEVKPHNALSRKADIVLDGQKLFEIGSSGNFSATQRAEKINSLLQNKLKEYANSPEELNVAVAQQSDWTVIRVNDRHLLTVSENDLIPGIMAQEQAEIWQEQIELALEKGIKERSPARLKWTIKMIAIAFTLVAGIQFGLFCLKRHFSRKRLESSQRWISWTILAILTLQTLVWLILVYYCTYLFPQTRTWQYNIWQSVSDTFNTEIFDFGGETAISLRRIIILISLGIGWLIFVRWFSQMLKLNILPLTGFESTLQSSIAFLTRYGLLFLGMLLILNGGGIDFRSLTIVISALGVGIGFGLQNIVKDFVSGIILTLTRPIKIGELVEVGDDRGLVLHIGARTTEISHVDRYIMTIPNSRFIEETVRNWHRSGLTRVKVYADVAYDSDRDLVYKALLAAAQVYHPDILKHPPPKAKFRNFGDRSLLFRVVVFIKDPFKEPKVRNHLQRHIDLNFRKYGIEIPFPQRDLNFNIPQLDELVANLVKIYAPSQPKLYYPQGKTESGDHNLPSIEELTIRDEYDWDDLVAAMRGEHGVKIMDRRYGLKTYSKVFLGTEAVSWLIQYEKATLSEAIAIGQLMIEQNIIHHILDEHNFKNEPLFYRFYLDENDHKLMFDD
ncbi:mechanosensitive ion channel [Waterburya agarophytonicola K14]|uniref:Mechanosensitive ion channel n=1 Tax=Waterburya agarophytonicola KI4 TaxID=2874699 RepID=A0A964FF47_9CYAN|nr:mechanosensitive ion channel domain-containing protein [Waterburya agarophytonicola]MCC0175424.1 mechanosensitive ion channel [Waterburya agarophytonicola KI4]